MLGGIPQGLVLGSLLFTIPLCYILQEDKIVYNSYVDDTQIYLSFITK